MNCGCCVSLTTPNLPITDSDPIPGDLSASDQSLVCADGCADRASAVEARAVAGAGEVEEVYHRCRGLGMRLSKQRRMVLELLWAEKSHLSARDIFEKLNSLGRHIGHTSVYQNLEALQSAGVIECLDRASGRLYGYRSDPHSHLTCSQTGSIQDLDVELPEGLLRQIESATGYLIESYTLHLTGRPRA